MVVSKHGFYNPQTGNESQVINKYEENNYKPIICLRIFFVKKKAPSEWRVLLNLVFTQLLLDLQTLNLERSS